MNYRDVFIKDLVGDNRFSREGPVKVWGIPRGSSIDNHGDTIWGYLQRGEDLLPFNARPINPGMPAPDICLLRTASETGIEVMMKGIYSPKRIEGYPGELLVHYVR